MLKRSPTLDTLIRYAPYIKVVIGENKNDHDCLFTYLAAVAREYKGLPLRVVIYISKDPYSKLSMLDYRLRFSMSFSFVVVLEMKEKHKIDLLHCHTFLCFLEYTRLNLVNSRSCLGIFCWVPPPFPSYAPFRHIVRLRISGDRERLANDVCLVEFENWNNYVSHPKWSMSDLDKLKTFDTVSVDWSFDFLLLGKSMNYTMKLKQVFRLFYPEYRSRLPFGTDVGSSFM